MEIETLNNFLKNKDVLESKFNFYLVKKIIRKQDSSRDEIIGHFEKAEHNLIFSKDNLNLGYID